LMSDINGEKWSKVEEGVSQNVNGRVST